jgi:hypothetical protein
LKASGETVRMEKGGVEEGKKERKKEVRKDLRGS